MTRILNGIALIFLLAATAHAQWRGDFVVGDTAVNFKFTTRATTGVPTTLAGSPVVKCYKNNSTTTETTTGVTLSVDFDSVTGLNNILIDTSADGTFYAAGTNVQCLITTGTVNSVSVVGEVVGEFSLYDRSPLRPTTSGRTLDVSAGGEAGVDWANVGSPTATLNLSGTTIKTSTDIATLIGAPAGASLSADVAGLWIRRGTAQAGAASTITLDSGASSVNAFYSRAGTLVVILSGTGAGQVRLITGYVGSTRVATVNVTWVTNPDNTSVFLILPRG